ncbi:hypothetical protein ABT115_24120 [Streptomyces sp. NPDC001832]|uniref:hypothetical protein n=1 Tax=Streptomyces sp. NPDC001832 TaxID=3154527 RepID=UPI003317747F
MNDHPHDGAGTDADVQDCVNDLRAALAAHGVTLPSLGIDLPTFAALHRTPPLITLGNCNLPTARALVAALRKGVA